MAPDVARRASPPQNVPDLASDFACLKLNLGARDQEQAIHELHERIGAHPAVRDRGLLLRDLRARSALGSNCLSTVVALAHARTDGVDDLIIAAGRSPTGIRFDPLHPSIRLVLLVAAPRGAVQQYLRCTVDLARRLRDPVIIQGLLAANSADDFEAVWAGRSVALRS